MHVYVFCLCRCMGRPEDDLQCFLGPFLLNVNKLWAHSDLNQLDRKSWGSICPNPHIHTHFCSGVISKNQHILLLCCCCCCFVLCAFFWVLGIQTQFTIFALKSFGQQTISSFPIFCHVTIWLFTHPFIDDLIFVFVNLAPSWDVSW